MQVRNTFSKNLKSLGLAASLAGLFFTAVLAAPMPTNVLVSELEPNVGQDVTISLRIRPDAANPVFTVSSKLSYDAEKLKFKSAEFGDESAIPLREVPYQLTDTSEGIIVRTAGYPKGLAASSNFVKYTFTAVKNGQAYVNILGGQALDSDNVDTGIEKKEILLSIGGMVDTPKSITASVDVIKTVTPIVKKKSAAFTLSGETILCKDSAYNFNIDLLAGADKSVQGKYEVSVLDKTQSVMFEKKVNEVVGINKTFAVVIPEKTLAEGSYLLRVKNTSADQASDKDIGVIDCNSTVIGEVLPSGSMFDNTWVNKVWGAISFILLGLVLLLFAHDRHHHLRNRKN